MAAHRPAVGCACARRAEAAFLGVEVDARVEAACGGEWQCVWWRLKRIPQLAGGCVKPLQPTLIDWASQLGLEKAWNAHLS